MSEWKQMTASNQAGRTVVNQPNITSIDANNSNGSLQWKLPVPWREVPR